ncbi:MAG: Crp/Fnr family transcriptional regulator [Treponema sp.]|nr:Crp/Fnr family transcriptional regulator [Treponema sp.]
MDKNVSLNFKEQIKKIAEISEGQIEDFFEATTKVLYKKNEYFSTIKNQSTSVAFIAKGLFRVYIIDLEGNEATLNFRIENMPMSSYGAIILNETEPVYIQALENSEIYEISRSKFLEFWQGDNGWKTLLQKITELDCLQLRRREFSFLLDDAKTRYINFLNDYGKHANRIKLRYVASYLGITSEALSRIRSAPMKASFDKKLT